MEALRLEENKILLTTGEVADLYNTSIRTVRNWIKSGRMQSIIQIANKGRGGVSHMVPLSSLDDKRQIKYWKKNKDIAPIQAPEDVRVPKQLDEFTEDERKVIQQWLKAINEWTVYRSRFKGKKTLVDQEWVQANQRRYKDINLSADTLYRKWKALKNNDYDGLVDKRGKWAKGKNSIPEAAWEVFKYIYLDENQLPMTECHKE